ncbi:MAG: hypothetical protein VX700_02600 [Pseudomonadota bacterium]|nr:hypothetical protein [Pseudomonadota bacterium]
MRRNRIYIDWFERVTAIAARRGIPICNLAADPDITARRADFYDWSHCKPDVGNRIIREIYAARPDGA